MVLHEPFQKLLKNGESILTALYLSEERQIKRAETANQKIRNFLNNKSTEVMKYDELLVRGWLRKLQFMMSDLRWSSNRE